MAKIKGVRKKEVPTFNKIAGINEIVRNATTMRQQLYSKLIDGPNRDINQECQYPDDITPAAYHQMYEREGIAARLVDIWPKECWEVEPDIYEVEDSGHETLFEAGIKKLDQNNHLFHFMSRIDKLSGVGRFGIILIGIDDGLTLEKPIEGVTGEAGFLDSISAKTGVARKLLYLRVFDESVTSIASWVTDETNPRFGCPETYKVDFQDESGHSFSRTIHWSRAVHIADERLMSEIYGTPRMQQNYNRIMDMRKILSGSGEMFWKGAFPGYSFEVDQDNQGVELDEDSLREEMENYMNRLQRYLALTGVSVKSLAPQVSDPTSHFHANLEAVCIALGIPKRKFMGSEQGELASSQDTKTWNKRVAQRQNDYLTPMLVRPIIDRLIEMKVLPAPEEYFIEWPDLTDTNEGEQAETAGKWANAISKYVAGGCEAILAPDEFFSIFGKMSPEEIEQINKGLKSFIDEMEKDLLEQGLIDENGNPIVESDSVVPDDVEE